MYIKNNKTWEATKKYDEDKKIHRIYFNCMPIHTFLTYFNSIQVLVVERTNTNTKNRILHPFHAFISTHKKTYENGEGLNFGSTNSKANKKENNNNSILSIHPGTL